MQSIEDRVRKVVREELANKPTLAVDPDEDLVSCIRAAKLTGLHPTTIRGWLNAGKIKRYGSGRTTRISRAELISFLGSLTQAKRETHDDIRAFAERALKRSGH